MCGVMQGELESFAADHKALAAGTRKKLLLYLAKWNDFRNVPISATLAWLCRANGCVFDNYFDSYHEGVHHPGGDWREIAYGKLSGGTVCGDRHYEQFCQLLLYFDVSVVTSGETLFRSVLRRLSVPSIVDSEKVSVIYKKAFSYFGVPLPSTMVMIGSNFGKPVRGLEGYLFPEIFYREALGVHETISERELGELCKPGGRIFCFCVNDEVLAKLVELGYAVECADRVSEVDDYLSVTKRSAERWRGTAKGWLLGDPVLVSHWIPSACEKQLIPIYGTPQEGIIHELKGLIPAVGNMVYGRQYSDRDFFALSRLNQCFQVVDPCRPPFQSIRHVNAVWEASGSDAGLFESEYADDELRRLAHEKTVMVSLVFWSGMVRELVNLYNLMDLVAVTQLRCGLVLTSESFEFMVDHPLELLMVPIDQGGVYPLVEVLLGSCGCGVGIESFMERDRLREGLVRGLRSIGQRIGNKELIPKGWWGTLDTDLDRLAWWKRPAPVQFHHDWPYFRVRVPSAEKGPGQEDKRSWMEHLPVRSMRKAARSVGISKCFSALRPYECYQAGAIKRDVVCAVKAAGLEYMFTKASFNAPPAAQYLDDEFIAMNYTAGRWDGWTPFETVNNVRDLRSAERRLMRAHRPGWLVSTIDACQWTFGGEFWKKAPQLLEIAQFCSSGGKTGKLLNVKPFTIARYARMIAEEHL